MTGNGASAVTYAVVIPTIGRVGLSELIHSADREPHPVCIVVADDRSVSAAAPPPLHLPVTRAPLIVVRSGGRGPAAARNSGWRAAVDAAPALAWVAFVDDDVVLADDWNAQLAADLAGRPGSVGASQARLEVPLPEGHRPTDEERRTLGLVGAAWITADMAYRCTVLESTGGFDERFPRPFREDADLAVRALRAGFDVVWGERITVHPVRARGGWRGSIAVQAGNADNALMRAKFGRSWRQQIGTTPGRMGRHLLTVGAALTAAAALIGGRPRLAGRAGLVWGAVTAEFALRRIWPGPRTPEEIAAMLLSSAAIPPVAVFHRLKGEWAVRFAPGRTRRSDVGPPLAVLFDRDGTLITNVPYLADPDGVEPIVGARRTLRSLRRRGVPVGVVSNQSGVARGLISLDALARVNARVDHLLGPFDTWQVCPHGADDACSCRKPAPGMVEAAARELGVRPSQCVLIGDIGADVDAALAAGARAVLVPNAATRLAEIDRASVLATVAPTLGDAVRLSFGGWR
ncbi:MAG TPA: HAD-IIIA family hydrolase [Microlunatus sp.]